MAAAQHRLCRLRAAYRHALGPLGLQRRHYAADGHVAISGRRANAEDAGRARSYEMGQPHIIYSLSAAEATPGARRRDFAFRPARARPLGQAA